MAPIRYLAYLWVALAEDTVLFARAGPPRICGSVCSVVRHLPGWRSPCCVGRRGQWAAFALAQAIALIWWRRKPVWLAVADRFSDIFTDLLYLLAVSILTSMGWTVLLLPPLLNLLGVVIMMMAFGQASGSATASRSGQGARFQR